MEHTVCPGRPLRGRIDGILDFLFDRSNSCPLFPTGTVDKKAKKRLDVINKKLQTLRPRLAGSREQADDPSELQELENEIAKLEAEATELKAK